jgi:DNA processing protein
MTAPDLSDRKIAAATLASLPSITPARLWRLLDAFGDPLGALDAVVAGLGAAAIRGSRHAAEHTARMWAGAADVQVTRRRLQRRGARVWVADDDDYPIRDPVPGRPAVLFGEGTVDAAFAAPRVAMVGTRSASPHGLADAREIAAHLATAGVTVVSGLAIGVDSASHQGALAGDGFVIGVVATGLDVTYPRRHDALYAQVRRRGMILSEHAYGVQPHRAQFPVRNRIIAALCDVCVVVEATLKGGATITAAYANDYSRTVFALPGARRNEAAAGCNALIKDGAELLLDPGDILIELGKGRAGDNWQAPLPRPPDPDEARVLATLAGEPAGTDELVERCGMATARVAGAIRRLAESGAIERRRGRWWPK